jgi:hypothetical protein
MYQGAEPDSSLHLLHNEQEHACFPNHLKPPANHPLIEKAPLK